MPSADEACLTHPLLRRITPWTDGSILQATSSECRAIILSSASVVLMYIATGTLVWKHVLGMSLGDSFYFSVVTFLTIGYGDITPASSTAKAFFIVYTVLGLVVQLTVVSTVLSNMLTWRPPTMEDCSNPPQDASLRMYFQVRPRIIRALEGFGMLALILGVGASMMYFVKAHDGRYEPWIDCWYWSVTTISTVGYGDIVPYEYRPMFAVYFLVAVSLFAYVLGHSVALVSEISKYRRLEKFFANGLSPRILDDMDAFRDGQVSQVEFMMFILERLDLVDREDLDRILAMFRVIDCNHDGVLSLADVRDRLTDVSVSPRSAGRGQSS